MKIGCKISASAHKDAKISFFFPSSVKAQLKKQKSQYNLALSQVSDKTRAVYTAEVTANHNSLTKEEV